MKGVLIALADHANSQRICWPSRERIALFAGLCVRAVDRQIKELEKRGFIRVDRSKGRRSHHYLLLLPVTSNPAPHARLNGAPHAGFGNQNEAPDARKQSILCSFNPVPSAPEPPKNLYQNPNGTQRKGTQSLYDFDDDILY